MGTDEHRRYEDKNEDRRSHCGNHDDHSADIVTMKSSINLLKWFVGVGTPVCCLFLGFGANMVTSHLNSMSTGITEVKNIVQAAAVSAASDRARLDALERDVRMLEQRTRK